MEQLPEEHIIPLPEEFTNSLVQQEEPNLFSYFSSSPLTSPFLENGFSSPAELMTSDSSSPDHSAFSTDPFVGIECGYVPANESYLFATDPALQQFMDPSLEQASYQNMALESLSEGSPIDEESKASDSEDDEKPKKRGRKRQKRDPNESTDVTAVQLTREELLKMTSAEYDQKMKAITDKRDLTWSEKKEVKKQRRLIKNRESAQASRQRKKEQFDTLETEMNKIKSENSILLQQVTQLKQENSKLKQYITLMKKMDVPSVPANVKKGAVLLALLFSFGLLFNVASQNGPFLNFGPQLSRTVSSVVGSSTSMGKVLQEQRATARKLLEFPETTNHHNKYDSNNFDKQLQTRQTVKQSIQLPSTPKNDEQISFDGDKNPNIEFGDSTRRQIQNDVVSSQRSNQRAPNQPHKIQITERQDTEIIGKPIQFGFNPRQQNGLPDSPTTSNSIDFMPLQLDIGMVMEEFENESSSSNVTSLVQNPENKTLDELNIKVRPNTAYFISNDFHHIKVPHAEPFDQNKPLYISLIVPSSTLPSASLGDSFIEINCQLMEINISPAGQLATPTPVQL